MIGGFSGNRSIITVSLSSLTSVGDPGPSTSVKFENVDSLEALDKVIAH